MSPQELITHFSTQAAAAKALGCAQSTVAEWCSDGAIPEGRQYQIELATAGALVADKPALREPMAAPTKEAVMSFEVLMRDCADHESSQLAAGERYAARVHGLMLEVVNEWMTSAPAERAEDMFDAFDHCQFDQRLFTMVMRLYRAGDREAVELVQDAARLVAERRADIEGDDE